MKSETSRSDQLLLPASAQKVPTPPLASKAALEPAHAQGSHEPAGLQLSPEEVAVLRSHPDEDLSKLIAQAEQAYRTSSPRNLAETQRRYLLLLNLASKVQDAPEPARNDRERRLQEQYLEIEPTLDPSERAAFKEDFFRDAVESQHPEEEKP